MVLDADMRVFLGVCELWISGVFTLVLANEDSRTVLTLYPQRFFK